MRAFTEVDRPAILDLLKVQGPLNVPVLAGLLGINRTAVRQQLAVLQREGLVDVRVERRKVGRPTHLFTLTEKAESLFPQAYGPIAVTLLRQLRKVDGEGKVDTLFARRTRELLAQYRGRLEGMSLAEQFRELARIRADEGYMASAKGRCLTEHHCPIAALAKEFPEACRQEKILFETALGMKLDRTSHIASGDRSCTYVPRKD